MTISQKDRAILRELARQQMELAQSARNQELYRLWRTTGGKRQERPMIRIELGTFEHEILPGLMQCEGEFARQMERQIRKPMVNFTMFEDDELVPDYYGVSVGYSFTPFGLPVKRQETGGVGHHFIPYLHDLEEDEHLLGKSVWTIHEAEAAEHERIAQEVFGDILPVKRMSNAAYCTPMQDIVHIMNMDDMYMAMYDDEERYIRVMDRLCDDYLELFREMEQKGYLYSAARMQHLCQGTYCFTDELPDGKPNAKLTDCWLYMDAQEAAGISPAMYEELVFPSYKRVMDHFGLVSYGCCEATHPFWESCLKEQGNLRKVSISPWCDEKFMGEVLQNTGITYLRKPPATILGMEDPNLDEDAARACFRKTAEAIKGCKAEIIQRDVYQTGGNPEKVRRYVQIAREELGM